MDACLHTHITELCSLLRAGVQTPVCVFFVFADNDYAGTRFVFESVDTESIISPRREIFIPMFGLTPTPPSFDCPALVPLHPS